MRIIAGIARGRRIEAPKGWTTRPTLDRIRENLFNILGPRVQDSLFLDLFAGTGANGLEAVSRGAKRVVLVESDPKALAIIKANTTHLGFEAQTEIMQFVLPQGLDRITGPFDIVFADPPYTFPHWEMLFLGFETHHLVGPDGWVVCESSRKSPPPDKIGRFMLHRRAEYGDTALSIYS
jgi:16S rRNA (guanine(966)-N(2))-methyltransferase RsmD